MIAWAKKTATLVMIIAVVFLLGMISGGIVGWSWCKSGGYKAEVKEQKRELKAIDKMDTRQGKRREKLSKTRQVIRNVKDTRSCNVLDTPYPTDFISGMRRFYDSQAR